MKALIGLFSLFFFIQVPGSEITSIKAFKMSKEVNKSVMVEAIIVYVYRCPPCPPNAMCKPCDRDNVVLKDLTSSETIKAYVQSGSTFHQNAKEGEKVKIYLLRKEKEEVYALPTPYQGESYYQNLRKKCAQAESGNCCLSSVQNMQMLDASEAPDAGCPPHSTRDMLKCKDSFKWCY